MQTNTRPLALLPLRALGAVGVITLLTVAVAGCGKELGRVHLTGEGSGQTIVKVTAGKPLAVWTALDLKWEGNEGVMDANYDVELEQGGTVVAKATCNPFEVNVKTSSKTVNVGANHSMAYNGKMNCQLMPKTTGAGTLKATLHFTAHPTTLKIANMSLFVKE